MRIALSALTALTLLVHGYHPLAEDGGLYVAGVEHLLHPALFPHDIAFVTALTRFSLFAPLLAGIVRLTHLPLRWVLLLADLASIALTLFAARQLLRRCLPGDAAQLGGVALLAAWWTLPVAATSLMLMDPYLTARSLSMPLSLLAIAYALDQAGPENDVLSRRRSLLRCALCLLLAALSHPLMAAYAAALVVVLIGVVRTAHRHLLLWTLLTAIALALAATLHALAPHESPAVIAAAHSRYYWFLSQWHWYEFFGLAGPLIVLALLGRSHLSRAADALCQACIGAGLIAMVIALLFAHDAGANHLVARLQPLRVFLLLYAVMALLLGGALTHRALQSKRRIVHWLPVAALASFAAVMFLAQRAAFPSSPHVEAPWRANIDPWSRAFLWARDHTPPDALFALDADYISVPGEDAQNFRATAERSMLPDFSKDGGEASITPSLAVRWQQGVAAQTGLSTESDALREARLRPLGVTWILLRSTAVTAHPCPYDNGTVKVCRLTP